MNSFRRYALLCLVGLLLCWVGGAVDAAQSKPKKAAPTKAKSPSPPVKAYTSALVVDAKTGRVLFEDAAGIQVPPASILKLMDLLIILERVNSRQLSLQDRVPVSAKAAGAPPSSAGLMPGESFTLEEMLYALMVRSANDVAIALAEKVSGSTGAFVELMNRRAAALGMTNTTFRTVNGLPPTRGEQVDLTTARDLMILCRALVQSPQALRYTSTERRVFRPNAGKRTVNMVNHNHLLGKLKGCDGLKTGFTARAGFCIAVTATRKGERVIAIVLGSPDSRTRDNKVTELVNGAFAALGVK